MIQILYKSKSHVICILNNYLLRVTRLPNKLNNSYLYEDQLYFYDIKKQYSFYILTENNDHDFEVLKKWESFGDLSKMYFSGDNEHYLFRDFSDQFLLWFEPQLLDNFNENKSKFLIQHNQKYRKYWEPYLIIKNII